MRKRKHWLYAMTFLGGCLLLTPGSGSVLAGEQFSYQLRQRRKKLLFPARRLQIPHFLR